MAVNYNDDRFLQVEEEKNEQLSNINNTYEDLINEREELEKEQAGLVDKWEQTQNENLDKQLQFQKDLIEQQRQEAEKNYEKEAASAYTDYRKETDAYGVSREQQYAGGYGNAQGYTESSKVSMYNTYQNRLSTARQSMDKAYLEFDNAIREAQLTNDVTKAENALTALQQKLQIALEGFNYKSETTQNQLTWQQQINSDYYNRYQDVLGQINYENEQAEAIRQFNEQLAFQKEQAALEQQRWEKEYALQQQQLQASLARSYSSGGSGRSYSSSGGSSLSGGSGGGTAANGRSIVANPYTGTINPDTKYGVFEYSKQPGSGYQPNNVNGNPVSKSGMTVSKFLGTTGNTGSTGINIDNQSVWKANGRYYIWDGSQDKYIDVTNLRGSKGPFGGGAGGGGFR